MVKLLAIQRGRRSGRSRPDRCQPLKPVRTALEKANAPRTRYWPVLARHWPVTGPSLAKCGAALHEERRKVLEHLSGCSSAK